MSPIWEIGFYFMHSQEKNIKQKNGHSRTQNVLFLSLLMLIAPCSVKGAIKHTLGLKASHSFNSKNAFHKTSHCNSELCSVQTTMARQTTKVTNNPSGSGILIKQHITQPKQNSFPVYSPSTISVFRWDVPMYILYKRLKYSLG